MSVRLVDIRKEFTDPQREGGRTVAVKDMNLEIKNGEFVTLLGPSGCGKTTSLRMIAGFEIPTSGHVWIGERMVNDVPPNKRDTTMVFQSYAIFPHMSVEQNVGFGLELKGRPKAEIAREVGQVMEVMGITELGKRRPDQLSGGQQQRVALARAVVNKPRVLLFDEPLSNLDAKLRESMRVEIRRIQQTFGITSVYVTHDQAEAMTVSDRIVVMEKGLVMQVGTPFEIYSRPSCQFVADFIGKVNLFPVKVMGQVAGQDNRIGQDLQDKGKAYRTLNAQGREFLANSATVGVQVGKEAFLAVRPESLEIGPEGKVTEGKVAEEQTPPGTAASFGSGKITKAVYLGSVVEYEIDAGLGKPIYAVSYDPVNGSFLSVGDSVSFTFSAKAAHLLPKA
ncbi:MAG: iron(III) transport system ATP-binding protein [Spirochaetes bacterium]|nr:MAG: iron(III) transport system ATP-binding protein [Spirochaetota bacterium]